MLVKIKIASVSEKSRIEKYWPGNTMFSKKPFAEKDAEKQRVWDFEITGQDGKLYKLFRRRSRPLGLHPAREFYANVEKTPDDQIFHVQDYFTAQAFAVKVKNQINMFELRAAETLSEVERLKVLTKGNHGE